MSATRSQKTLMTAGTLALVSLSLSANEPILPIAFGLGLTFMASLSTAGGALLVISLIEAVVLRRMLAWTWRESLQRSFFANLFSTLVGLGVMIASATGEVYLIGCLVGAVFLMRLIPRLNAGSGRFGWLRRHLWLGGIGTAVLLFAFGVSAAIIQGVTEDSPRILVLRGFMSLLLLAAGFGLSILTEAWVLYRRHPVAGVKLLRATVWMNIASYGVLLGVLVLFGIKNVGIKNLSFFKEFDASRNAQKRTMGDMKALATAIEAFSTDNDQYPAAGNMEELCRILVPDYLKSCIRHDGWSTRLQPRDFAYFTWKTTSPDCWGLLPDHQPPGSPPTPRRNCGPHSEYVLASAGKDGVFEHRDLREYQRRDTCTYNNDIVIRNGEFLQIPHGVQDDGPDTHLPCGPGGKY